MKLREICLWEVLDNRTKLNIVKALEKARDILSRDYRVISSKVTDKGTAAGKKTFTSFEIDIQFPKEGDDTPFKKGRLKRDGKEEIFQDIKKELDKFRIDAKLGGGFKRPDPHEAAIEISDLVDGTVNIRILFGNP
jgi:hypothetical protein